MIDNEKEWLLKNNFCVMPFTHINIDNKGNCLTCCKGDPINDENNKPINIKDFTLTELWNHPARQKVVDAFLKNERHPACRKCWREKDQQYSARVKFSLQKKGREVVKHYMETGKLHDYSYPLSLEIRPGNICNLKCRICTVYASSSWAKDTFELWYNPDTEDYKDTPISDYNKSCQWFDDDMIWNDPSILKNVYFIHFLGGEPMMAEKHFNLLDKVAKIKDPQTIEIKYNTNGTILPKPEQVEILKQFKDVVVGASIDDMGHRFEYQRKNGIWKEVERNIDYMYQLTPHIYIDSSISILNGYHIDEFFNFCDFKGWYQPEKISHWVNSHGLDLRSLTKTEKDFFYKKLKQGTNYRTCQIIEYMMSSDLYDSSHQHMRYKLIKELDGIRGENFFEVYPELKNVFHIEDND